ncbi:MAG: hydrogenase expression/formation protein HypE [Candidatus Saccharicenans sp.]|nr:MAG: hydrogenase expression/formation protein HypE [Candidatus Aminicenantes bacterium]HEK84947.1 hydrogenase expression/formation protein HypE [Candidatus Aminicenantes bacterium]
MNKVNLEMGSGGKLMRDFIAQKLLPTFNNPILNELHDSAFLPGNLAFTTDSYTVDPIFFPGGDIGTLCVNGTINDLVVSGAKPEYLSLALIIEEGLEFESLERVLKSIKRTAAQSSVRIVTGDTKVVPQGQGDQIFINTAGLGHLIGKPHPEKIKPGDKLIVTGSIGEHGLAIMLARNDFRMFSGAKSDCAPLLFLLPLWKKGVLWMRDITRGGLATVLSELSEKINYPILVEEANIPLSSRLQGAVEILGIDPLYLACEGRALLVVPEKQAESLLKIIKRNRLGKGAAIIGEVQDKIGKKGEALLRTTTGGLRLLEPLTTELLPRIC